MIRISFEGKEYSSRDHMPDDVRRAYDQAILVRDGGASTDLTAILMLAFLAGFVIVSGIALMYALGGGPRHLGGRLATAAGAVFLIGWIDSMATRVARRRDADPSADSPGYHQFVVGCAVASAVAAVLLFGVALYLP